MPEKHRGIVKACFNTLDFGIITPSPKAKGSTIDTISLTFHRDSINGCRILEKETHVEFEAIRRAGGGTMEAINITAIEESDLYSEVRPDKERLQRLANLTDLICVLELIDDIIEDMIHESESYSEDSLDEECSQSRLASVLEMIDVLEGIEDMIHASGSYSEDSLDQECLQSMLTGVLEVIDVLKGILTTAPARGSGTTSTPREGRCASGNNSDAVASVVASSNVIDLITPTKSREDESNLPEEFGDLCIGESSSAEEAVSKRVKDAYKNDEVIDVC